MCLCKSIIIKVHFIKILMTPSLKETIIYQLQWKCKTNQDCLKLFKKEKETSVKEDKVNTRI